MLYVQGVTPQLLFGNDLNRNGILDPDEDDGTGALDMGWSAYLTIYSRELNVDSQGNPRIYVNDPNLQSLANQPDDNADFDENMASLHPGLPDVRRHERHRRRQRRPAAGRAVRHAGG